MGTNIIYSPVLGETLVNVANPNLDGTGTINTVVTATLNGLIINSISIKSLGTTTPGMIRLFIDDGTGGVSLLREIMVPATTQTSVEESWGIIVKGPIKIKTNYSLGVSTEKGENFSVIAECLAWDVCEC